MGQSQLDELIAEYELQIVRPESLVRIVLSGRRRNMQTPHQRIDIRPVLIKDVIQIQVSYSDGRQMTSKNYPAGSSEVISLLNSGYANYLLETVTESLALRITKKGEALIHRSNQISEQNL